LANLADGTGHAHIESSPSGCASRFEASIGNQGAKLNGYNFHLLSKAILLIELRIGMDQEHHVVKNPSLPGAKLFY
jgi:hypothetical protein